jgi:hypothetical protein
MGPENFGKLILSFFVTVFAGNSTLSEARIQAGWNIATRYRCTPKVTIQLLFRVRNRALAFQLAHASSLVFRV